jgi:mycofactocin precursor
MEQAEVTEVVETAGPMDPAEEPVVAEALIEEISIDGMCGVY